MDDHVIEKLMKKAKENHRSLEGEVRHLLTQQSDRLSRIAAFRERSRQLISLTADSVQSDSADLLREARDR